MRDDERGILRLSFFIVGLVVFEMILQGVFGS